MPSLRGFPVFSLQGLLDELDVIELLEVPGQTPIVEEITEKQTYLYKKLGFTHPSLQILGT